MGRWGCNSKPNCTAKETRLFFVFFSPKIFFNPQILYIATRHPNIFFHKLCLSIVLLRTGVYQHVTLGYAIENSIVIALCQNFTSFFWPFFHTKYFFSPQILYIATLHPNNFFHKLCLSIALLGTGLYQHVTLG